MPFLLLPTWLSPRSFLYVLIVAVSRSVNKDSARVDMAQGDWRSRGRDYRALKAMPWRPRFFQSLSWYLGPCSTTLTNNIITYQWISSTGHNSDSSIWCRYKLSVFDDMPEEFRLSNWTPDYAGARTFKLKVIIKY